MKLTLSLAGACIAACFIFQSCSYQIYEIASKDSYPKRVDEHKPKKFVILDKSYFTNDVDVVKLINVLNKNQYKQESKSFALTKEEHQFITAIDLLMNKQYNFSLSALNSLADSAFDCQVGLLKADCRYYMGMSADLIEAYQLSHDCTSEQTIKEISKNRYRFTLYGF